MSKYTPTEFCNGVKYYQGTCSPNNAEREDKGYSEAWIHHPGETVDSGLFDRYAPMMESFGKIVAGEKENPWDYDYELNLFKLILQCCGR